MVKLMCESAPKVIEWLDSIGVPFSRTKDGELAQRRLGGTKYPRACYSQDYSGLKIIQTLYDNALKNGINFLNRHLFLDLIVEENYAKGAVFLDIKNGEVKTIFANSIIIATGGYAGIFHSHTTNNYSQNGDAIAISLRCGAKVSNLNYVQFHPTGLKSSSVLISESARGAGGKLINQNRERFVDELLPRDKVSLAMIEEIEKGNDIFLDITHLGEEFIDENLPQERKLAIFYEGVDPVKEPIPVKPVAHYSMGGIAVDENLQTSIKNLYAVGECSDAKVHGKNRLGGNSLLEIVAFGIKVGEEVGSKKGVGSRKWEVGSEWEERIEDIFEREATINFYQKQKELGEKLYFYAGVKKDIDRLQKLLLFIENLEDELPKMGVFDKGRTLNTNLVDFIKFQNTLSVSKAYVEACIKELS
jgi:succinate dehydrogenase / fumarate reductase flavoprotein subunit